MRIVSLLPSATEIVCELGLRDALVGVSHDCDWPPEIENIPALSASAVGNHLGSVEIDETVRQRLHHGMSVYHLDPKRLRALAPDLILTQELCEVCAPAFDEVQRTARSLEDSARIVSLEPGSLEDILETITVVGRHAHREERAAELRAALRARIEAIERSRGRGGPAPRVAAIEWLEPLFVAGHWVPEMIELAGGESMSASGTASYEIGWEDLERFDPDIVVVMPCGFSPQRTARELHLLTEHPAWQRLRAARNRQVHIVHGSYYFNRPGPRIVTGLEILARILDPQSADPALPPGALYALDELA